MAQPVSLETQEAWFCSLSERRDYLIWGLKSVNWIGACGLKNIDPDACSAEYWGYIFPPDFRGAGIGSKMFKFICKEACKSGIDKLWLRVAETNEAAISAYQRWGFSETQSKEGGVIYMETCL